LFYSTECSTGQKLTTDKAAHFMNISSNVFKFAFDFRNARMVFLQSSNCTVNTMKHFFQFNICSSYVDCKDFVVNRIIFGGKVLTDDDMKDSFKTKDENCIRIMCSNSLQITNNISNVQDFNLKHNIDESKKMPITSTPIINESILHVTNTKQVNETAFCSRVFKKESSINEAPSKNNSAEHMTSTNQGPVISCSPKAFNKLFFFNKSSSTIINDKNVSDNLLSSSNQQITSIPKIIATKYSPTV